MLTKQSTNAYALISEPGYAYHTNFKPDHRLLQSLSTQTGKGHQEIIHDALNTYQRERLLDAINDGYARLKSDKSRWAELTRERRLIEKANTDGLID